jgi:hypothetical protein
MWPSVDPYEDWKEGPAKLLRYRHLAVLVLVDSGLAVGLWNLMGPSVGIPIVVCSLMAAAMFFYLKRRWIQELQVGIAFHAACHFVRDSAAQLERLFTEGKKTEYFSEYGRLHDALANIIADYFHFATRDSTVACAIRLVMGSDNATAAYVTKGRSLGMEPNRKDVSVPIPVDKGLAKKLRVEDHRGVCHITDIGEAIKDGWWMPCPSDNFPDVKYLMVAPINWYDRTGKKAMGGILYVTSRRDNLAARHVEPTKAFADLLGMIYPAVTGTFEREGVQSAP